MYYSNGNYIPKKKLLTVLIVKYAKNSYITLGFLKINFQKLKQRKI